MVISRKLNRLMDQYITGWRELEVSPYARSARAEIQEETGYADQFRDPDMEDRPEGEPDYSCANFWHNYTGESLLMHIFEDLELDPDPSLKLIQEYGAKIVGMLRLKYQILILRDGSSKNTRWRQEIQEAEHRVIFKMGQWMLYHASGADITK